MDWSCIREKSMCSHDISSIQRYSILFFIIILFIFLIPIYAFAQEEPVSYPDFTFHGYYKNLLIDYTDPTTSTNYLKDFNRLRLKMEGRFNENWSTNIHYELRAFPNIGFLPVQGVATQDNYLNLNWVLSSTPDYIVMHGLDRAYVTYSTGKLDVSVGRQRIAWGTGKAWNPTDLFNPFNPLEIDKEEKTGTDAVTAIYSSSDVTRTSLVYNVRNAWASSSVAIKHQTTINDIDYSVMAGKFKEDTVYGFDFAGALQEIGMHGEATYTQSKNFPNYLRYVIGADRTFTNNFSIMGEYYFNGTGSQNPLQYNYARLLSGEVTNLAQNYLMLGTNAEITPLLLWGNTFIKNLDDGSFSFSPRLTYSYAENITIIGGIYFFGGDKNTEYGNYPAIYYVQLGYYF